eukprot:scaffold8150_cov116-Isochrysis_galbana.AAC.1
MKQIADQTHSARRAKRSRARARRMRVHALIHVILALDVGAGGPAAPHTPQGAASRMHVSAS